MILDNDDQRPLFDVEHFSRVFIQVLQDSSAGELGEEVGQSLVHYKPIILETYVGLSSLIYNANGLGFYKLRGKVSF